MPSAPRPSLPGRVAIAALAAASAACPAGFVDPNPPVLQRLERVWSPPIENEPVVYALLLDLHLARGLDCAGTKAQIASRVRSILITPSTPGIELPMVDISPNCRQAPDRHFDASALDLAIQGAERTYGSKHVRALLLYVNNIDLAVPESLQSDFASLRIYMAGRGAPLPIAWAITMPKGRDEGIFLRFMSWQHSSDSGMFSALASTAGIELPFQALGTAPPEGVPVFTPQEAASIVGWKFCGPSDLRISALNFTFDGKAKVISPGSPPAFRFEAPQAAPSMKSGFAFTPVRFWVEICTANCDHFSRRDNGAVAVWDETTGCFLPSQTGTTGGGT
jgi:hypothetical protein